MRITVDLKGNWRVPVEGQAAWVDGPCRRKVSARDYDSSELVQADVTQYWPHEAHDFTPWLSKNLDFLAGPLGIENLECRGTEVPVGAYKADIVARMPQDGSALLIENQLYESDIQHLISLLLYAAGLDARVIIWVAPSFRDAHLSVIRWLDEHAAEPSFFAVRVSVVRIGGSKLAPVFDVVERPQRWNDQIQKINKESGLTKHGKLRNAFSGHMAKKCPKFSNVYSGRAGSWIYFTIDGYDLRIIQYFNLNAVGVFISGKTSESRKDVWKRIKTVADRLEQELPTMTDQEHMRFRNSKYPCNTRLAINSEDRKNWGRMADWLDDTRSMYERVIRSDPSQGG